MTQSRALSLVEAAANVLVGYVLAVITQIVLFPLFGWNPTLAQNMRIGLAFAGVSLARGYLLRRLFERLRDASRSGDRAGHGEPARTHR
ncbi:hypothetical protein [Paracoccus sanguinis]|uniref:Uncharacterized protein n=1 Tax=Paracoccus sanguinis TaxID=1545044 RepID=A0A1H3CRU8_9RHOB|nr:hypothetical protein [Paracoccus sanguinis]SDX56962.1 hypothetical protein SAMN05444276_10974 [Paracoccus sanguinis]